MRAEGRARPDRLPVAAVRYVYTLPRAAADRFVAELWTRGTLGIEEPASPAVAEAEEDLLTLVAYFPPAGAGADPAVAAGTSLPWTDLGVRLDRVEEVPAEDWLAGWRAAARPFTVGRRFLLDPRQPADSEDASALPAGPAQRIRLRLPARGAFGTGSHETTRLALELLERQPLTGRSVLDVGCGTGVLAFAAYALGAGRVAGCDVDPVAAFHAVENRRLNRPVLATPPAAGPAFWAGGLAALGGTARFDVVVVNVLPERILGELPRLARAVAADGALVYSGTLTDGADEVARRFADHGLSERRRRAAGEWTALELTRR